MIKKLFRKQGKRVRHSAKNTGLLVVAALVMVFFSSISTYAEQVQSKPESLEFQPNEHKVSNEDNMALEQSNIIPNAGVEEPVEPAKHTGASYNSNTTLRLLHHKTGESEEIDIEKYLLHVLGGEIPYTFKEEAIKAQVVAARSYVVYRMKNNNSKAHEGGEDVCTSPAHCLAYATDEDFAKRFGSNEEKARAVYKKAVAATRGEILTYDGDVALAVFHAMSGGKTEDASVVWGGDYPYLTSAVSKGEESFSNFETIVRVPIDAFKEKAVVLGASETAIAEENPVEILEISSGGGVTSLRVYDVKISGSKARSAFGLRTGLFEVAEEAGEIVFRVLGWGHRVGLSQYGAEAMAREGAGYLDILGNYYKSCEIKLVM